MAKSIAIGMFTSKSRIKDVSHLFNKYQNQCDIDIKDLNCKFKCIVLEFDPDTFEISSNFSFSFFIEFNGKLYLVRVLRCETNG